jgi:hypothetical protein
MQRIYGFAQQGNTKVHTSGLQSTTLVQGSFPGATVTVFSSTTISAAISAITRSSSIVTATVPSGLGFATGQTVNVTAVPDSSFNGAFVIGSYSGTSLVWAQAGANGSSSGGVASSIPLAQIYSDNQGTPLSNPFTADNLGNWGFYAPNGAYNIQFSGTGITSPFTLPAVSGFDEAQIQLDVRSVPYLAHGDGSSDDTFAIQSALNDASVTGARVYMPPGTYKVSNFLRVPSGVSLVGSGWDSTIHAPSDLPFPPDWGGSASAVVFISPSSTGVTVRDLYVKGPYSGTGAGSTTFGISPGHDSANISILNCKVTHASWSGIFCGTGTTDILVHGNYTEHNAIDGIESFASRSVISNNRSFNDSADSVTPGVASIEILPGSSNVSVIGNISDHGNNQGIACGFSTGITIDSNQVYSPGTRGITDGQSTDIRITNNFVDTPRGSGALGDGILLTNTTRFTVANNTVVGALVGSGPSGIEMAGTTSHGTVTGNITYNNWVGLALTGTSGTTGTILVAHNHSYGNAGADYSNTSSGPYIRKFMNSFGATGFTASIPGITDASNAAAGDVGEYVSAQIALGSAISLSNGTPANVVSISLTAGDWDVSGVASFNFDPSTSYTILIVGISTVSTVIGGRDSVAIIETPAVVPGGLTDPAIPTPILRINTAGPFTAYLVAQGNFTISFLKAYGQIRARRVR